MEVETLSSEIRHAGKGYHHPPEIRESVIRLHQSGLSRKAIASKMRLAASTVTKWLRVPPKPANIQHDQAGGVVREKYSRDQLLGIYLLTEIGSSEAEYWMDRLKAADVLGAADNGDGGCSDGPAE